MNKSSQKIASLIEVLSPEHRILRYVVKMEKNIDNPLWENDKNVRRVKTDGKLDVDKVRQHFLERGIFTEQEFDDAVGSDILRGLVSLDLSSEGTSASDVSEILDTKQTEAQKVIDDAMDIERSNIK